MDFTSLHLSCWGGGDTSITFFMCALLPFHRLFAAPLLPASLVLTV